MLEGRLIQSGASDPFAEKPGSKAASATAYVWLVWLKDQMGGGTQLRWLSPCRQRLERPGDYPDYPQQSPAPAGGLLDSMEAA
jgi:hypothetical protein